MENQIVEIMKVENLEVEIFINRIELGKKAAKDVETLIKNLLEKKNEIRMIFAAAPSQNELLNELAKSEAIDWSRIVAFHMDEYIGINKNARQAFGQFLRDRLFDKVEFKEVHYLQSEDDDIRKLCENYAEKLSEATIDIVCMGIGENGHIAFNDPPFAKFKDPQMIKIVELDHVSRQQQVNDGCFEKIEDVPQKAVTLTIPTLLSGDNLIIVVPGSTKAAAVKETLEGDITEEVPATILRKHKNAKLYIDKDSASLLNIKNSNQ